MHINFEFYRCNNTMHALYQHGKKTFHFYEFLGVCYDFKLSFFVSSMYSTEMCLFSLLWKPLYWMGGMNFRGIITNYVYTSFWRKKEWEKCSQAAKQCNRNIFSYPVSISFTCVIIKTFRHCFFSWSCSPLFQNWIKLFHNLKTAFSQ